MGKRRVILETLRDTLNAASITLSGYKASFVIKIFDVSLRQKDLPLFSILTEPETLDIQLSGMSADRSLRLIIQGFIRSKRAITTSLSSDSLLLGEDFADAIVRMLMTQTAVDNFINSFRLKLPAEEESGCGFSITAMGPIIVEEYALASEFVYVSVPLLVEFLES